MKSIMATAEIFTTINSVNKLKVCLHVWQRLSTFFCFLLEPSHGNVCVCALPKTKMLNTSGQLAYLNKDVRNT